MNAQPKTRVLVVDDSALMRKVISAALCRDPGIEVVATAANPYEARDRILELEPDVLTLDIEMPGMDGLTFLGILQRRRPIPVVVVSSLAQSGSQAALAALEAGAVDVLAKPSGAQEAAAFNQLLPLRVKGAAAARWRVHTPQAGSGPAQRLGARHFDPRQIILIGSSTGGVEALTEVIPQLPDGLPGICIVQHIPPVFSKAFAERLNETCALEVREAVSGDQLHPGLALVAPGDFHMMTFWDNNCYRIVLNQGPAVHYTRPAVDMLFNSAAVCAGSRAVAALLTGMGSDGASGMQKLKSKGATTFAQNEETCVVYGMPRAAVELGVVDRVLPLDEIPDALVRSVLSRNDHNHCSEPSAPQPKQFTHS